MSSLDFVDLCSDDDIGESNGKDGRKEPNSAAGKFYLKRKHKIKKVQLLNSEKQFTRQESGNNRSSNGLSTGQSNSTVLDQGASPVDESSLSSASPTCPAPICRQFWKAGDYESGQGSKAATQNGKNHLRIHPMFLHSNATSHKWVFGAIAELLDNAVDEIQNGATFVAIDKISNPRDGSPALLIQDDGSGMDPETIRRCMSFGYSDKKLKIAIGQYGNGFKTSSMRLGSDVIVFSRHLKKRTLTQSIGLLSYTFLRQTSHDRIVVPMLRPTWQSIDDMTELRNMVSLSCHYIIKNARSGVTDLRLTTQRNDALFQVDYEFNASAGTFKAILPHGEEHFSSNLSALLQWSPFLTEEELLKQFDDIGNHGTKVVVYNLWLKDDGDMELDFDSNSEDIRISGDLKLFQANLYSDPIKDQHIANLYRYSLRAYTSVLYLRIPQSFRIILRGQIVGHRNIANDLRYPEIVLYKPQFGANVEAKIITTIGFWKDSPHVNFHGFNIYHRNRLIMPFWSVLKVNNHSSIGRGVVGVLEANFIEPTHNKQDFEKTSLFQKLESRLKDMTLEYWHLHCELIGFQPTKKNPRAPLASQELSSRTHSFQEPVLMNHNPSGTDSPRAALVGVGSFQYSVATPSHVSAKRPRQYVDDYQIRSQPGLNVKRKEHNLAAELERPHTGLGTYSTNDEHNGAAQLANGTENRLQDQETMSLLRENKKLQSQLSEIEKREEELDLKVQRLKNELETVQLVYAKLLAEMKSMDIIKEKIVNG